LTRQQRIHQCSLPYDNPHNDNLPKDSRERMPTSSLSRGGWSNANANPHKNNNPPMHQLLQTRLPAINLLQNKCTLENLHVEARKELDARIRTVPTTTEPQGIHLVSLIVRITIKSTQPQWHQIASLPMKPL
jgi:hypothetical protein